VGSPSIASEDTHAHGFWSRVDGIILENGGDPVGRKHDYVTAKPMAPLSRDKPFP